MTWREFLHFVRWIWRGKSARRAFLNIEIGKRVELKGRILDIGGKGRPSYQEVLLNADGAAWVVMDIFPGESVCFCGDATSIPLKDGLFDAAICFNVLEHVYDYRSALTEMCRILKANGLLYGYVPFICNVHGDPRDYWRFTVDCLRQILSDSGFTTDCVVARGGVFISCFDLASFMVQKVRPLRSLLAILLIGADILLTSVRPSYGDKYPVGLFFIGRKSF